MSVVYTADIFCDGINGKECPNHSVTHGATCDTPPSKRMVRRFAGDGFVSYNGKDFCRKCFKALKESTK